MVSVVISPLSFLIVFTWILSLFFLMSLPKGLSILFTFSKNQLLDSLSLRIVLLVSMSFNSALILVISFLLLPLGCLCCCSSTTCRRRVRLFVWKVSIFLSKAYIAMNFPLRTALSVSHRFWVVVSSFSFVSRKFLISSLISFLTHSLFNSMLFSLHDFECLGFFLWDWILVSVCGGQRKCLIWFQFSWTSWGLLCVLSCGLSLKKFHVHLKRMYILLFRMKSSLYIS